VRRLLLPVAATCLAALAAASLLLARARPEESLANGSGWVLALEAIASASLIAAALAVRPQRAAALFLATALCLAAQMLPLPRAGGSLLFTFALVCGGAATSLGGLSARAFDVRRARAVSVVAWLATAVCTLWIGLGPALVFDPAATGCFGCPRRTFCSCTARIGCVTTCSIGVCAPLPR
jgi:fucose permease